MKEYKFKINGKEYNVAIGEANGKMLSVNVNGADYEVEIERSLDFARDDNNARNGNNTRDDKAEGNPVISTKAEGNPVISTKAEGRVEKSPAGAAVQVTSPLPGVIVEVSVKEGQAVKAGQKVAVLEAMKMENEIPAARDGVITAIHVNKGDSVLEGAPIVSIA